MSDTAKLLFDGLRAGAQRFVSETTKELGHQVGRGATELGAAMFQGHSFVLYGNGQGASVSERQQQQSLQQERNRGMER